MPSSSVQRLVYPTMITWCLVLSPHPQLLCCSTPVGVRKQQAACQLIVPCSHVAAACVWTCPPAGVSSSGGSKALVIGRVRHPGGYIVDVLSMLTCGCHTWGCCFAGVSSSGGSRAIVSGRVQHQEQLVAMVADFGLACRLRDQDTHVSGVHRVSQPTCCSH